MICIKVILIGAVISYGIAGLMKLTMAGITAFGKHGEE